MQFSLEGSEKLLRNAYFNGGKRFLENKMTSEEFDEYVKEGLCITIPENTYYNNLKQLNTVASVESIAEGNELHLSIHPRYSYPVVHNHAYIEMIYVYTGKCKHFVESSVIEMKTGDLCILAPNTMHAISVADDDTIVVNIMMSRRVFDTAFMELLRGGTVLTHFFETLLYEKSNVCPYILYPTGEDKQIRELIEKIIDEVKNQKYAFQQSFHCYLQLLFVILIRYYDMLAIVPNPKVGTVDMNIVAILGYISVNYYRINLKETALFFGYTPSYLSKIIREHTGRSFSDIIEEYQMDNARSLLEKNNLSVTEIAHRVGCFDSSHFSRKFKNKYGLTPNAYRKQLLKK